MIFWSIQKKKKSKLTSPFLFANHFYNLCKNNGHKNQIPQFYLMIVIHLQKFMNTKVVKMNKIKT